MEDREMPRIYKYGENKTTRIMMSTVRHVTAWAGRTKYQAAWFLLNRVYKCALYFYLLLSTYCMRWEEYRVYIINHSTLSQIKQWFNV
jgi:hypothetical protein